MAWWFGLCSPWVDISETLLVLSVVVYVICLLETGINPGQSWVNMNFLEGLWGSYKMTQIAVDQFLGARCTSQRLRWHGTRTRDRLAMTVFRLLSKPLKEAVAWYWSIQMSQNTHVDLVVIHFTYKAPGVSPIKFRSVKMWGFVFWWPRKRCCEDVDVRCNPHVSPYCNPGD